MKLKALKTKAKKGFTIIEIMIAVVLMGILAGIAYPSYQDYVTRAQASEALSLMSGAKILVLEKYALKGNLSDFTADSASVASGKYVETVTIGSGGVITATFNSESNKLEGGKVTLNPVPVEVDGVSVGINWDCKSPKSPKDILKYLPSTCVASS